MSTHDDNSANDLWNQARRVVAGYREATPAEVRAARGVRLIDVREPHEFDGELGHIEGAELVPLATVEAASCAWDKAELLVMVCRSGNRSGRAAARLVTLGFQKVINMTGGMLEHSELSRMR